MASAIIHTDPIPTDLKALSLYKKSDQLRKIRLPPARLLRGKPLL
jgi:hypothetical protein